MEKISVKNKGSGTIHLEVLEKIDLALGGHEGKKYSTTLLMISGKRKRRLPGQFVAKEYPLRRFGDVKRLVYTYELLRISGLPVPTTTRLAISENYSLYLLMTDMRNRGEWHIWGYSNKNDQKSGRRIKIFS